MSVVPWPNSPDGLSVLLLSLARLSCAPKNAAVEPSLNCPRGYTDLTYPMLLLLEHAVRARKILVIMWWVGVLLLLSVADGFTQVVAESAPGDFTPDENPRYFPVGVFAEGKSDGSSSARWYARQLRALQEPSLSESVVTGVESVYRFTWLRSFHHPIAIRITVHPDGSGKLTAKMTDGAGGYRPGRLIANSTREVGVKDVQRLLKLINTMRFWQMPPEAPARGDVVNLDGARWILEASRHGDYHVIDRWSPPKGPLRDLGLYLALTLGRLDVPPKTIY